MSKNDFGRFFNPYKSPKTEFKTNEDGFIVGYEYKPKNNKRLPIRRLWNSIKKGTFVRSKNETFFIN